MTVSNHAGQAGRKYRANVFCVPALAGGIYSVRWRFARIQTSMSSSKPPVLTEAQAIVHILNHCRTVAVVGLSPKAHRESYHVAAYMQTRGWRIIPINPVAAASGEPILGETVYATLSEAARHQKIDLVDVFRNSEDVPPVVDETIALALSAIWLQLGISHDAALAKAQAAGLVAVQNRCLKIELARLG